MDKIQKALQEEINDEIQKLSSLEPGSSEHAKATDDVVKLYRLRIEEVRAEAEQKDKRDRYKLEKSQMEQDILARSAEKADKEALRKDQNLDRWIGLGVQVGLAVGGWLVYDIWNRRGLKFEETGTITSPWTRNLVSRMLPKKNN